MTVVPLKSPGRGGDSVFAGLSDLQTDPKRTELTVALMQRAIRRGASHIVLMLGDAATGPDDEVDFLP